MSGTLSNVPYGHIVVTATLYDANRNPLAGSNLVSGIYFTSNTNLELSYRQTNVGQVLQQLQSGTAEDKFLAQQLDLTALQIFFDTVTGVSGNYPGYAFITRPSLVNVSAVVADLKAKVGNMLTLDAEAAKYKAAAGSLLLTVNSLVTGKDVSVSLDDPISNNLILATNGTTTLNNVPPGTWTLRVGGEQYESQRIPIVMIEGQTLPVTLNLVFKPKIIYVNNDVNGNNDGTSWIHAYRSLQDALSEAVDTDEVWMAAGKYTPHASDRDASFQLKDGVKLYGGFEGAETTRAGRTESLTDFVTVLSGDLTGNDNDTTPTTRDENSKTVVMGANNTSLEGVTIQGGNASGGGLNVSSYGGGMYYDASSCELTNVSFDHNSANSGGGAIYNGYQSGLTLNNVTFTDNVARDGAGMYNDYESNTILKDVRFVRNAASDDGGGIYSDEDAHTTLNDVTFSENTAEYGGGMYNASASLELTHVMFNNNTVEHDGAGMYNDTSLNITLRHVTFNENIADVSGGGFVNYRSTSTLTDVTFTDNSALYGGGLYNYDSDDFTATDLTFTGNAAQDGGGVYNEKSTASFTNSNFSSNTAQRDGGGLYNDDEADLSLTDVTFTRNTSVADGAGIYNYDVSFATLNNVTFDTNSASDEGGGMYNNDASASLDNVTFDQNTATNGGGGLLNDGASPTLTHVTFSNNATDFYGGGVYNYYQCSPTFNHVTFMGNAAGQGGGLYEYDSSSSLVNVIFSHNTSTQEGGGVYNEDASPTLTHVTFSNNSAASEGGGVYNEDSSPTLKNVLFWKSSLFSQAIVNGQEGNYDLGTGGDPFVDSSNSLANGLRLKDLATANSLAGVSTGVSAIDFLGNARPGAASTGNITVESGVYEYTPISE